MCLSSPATLSPSPPLLGSQTKSVALLCWARALVQSLLSKEAFDEVDMAHR